MKPSPFLFCSGISALLAAASPAGAAVIDLPLDVPGGVPADSIPWSASGTTALTPTDFTVSAGGSGLFKAGYSHANGARITFNSQAAGTVLTGYLELTFEVPVTGLSFSLSSFGTRTVNQGTALADMSHGTQTFSLTAYDAAEPLDLDSGHVLTAESLVTVADNGFSLLGSAGVFDAAGANAVGSGRGARFLIPGPVSAIRFDFTSSAAADGFGLIGDTVEFGQFQFTGTVPEPRLTSLGAVLGAALMRRRRSLAGG